METGGRPSPGRLLRNDAGAHRGAPGAAVDHLSLGFLTRMGSWWGCAAVRRGARHAVPLPRHDASKVARELFRLSRHYRK